MTKRPQYDERDDWATYYNNAPVVRRHPKRQRKPSLTSALKKAGKAGVAVNGATFKPDGSVVLEFGATENGSDRTINSPNPWDRVLQ